MDSTMPERTESSNVVDTHRIVSKLFNTQFNWFIAKYSTANASRGTLHIFARMLDEWRLSLARRSTISMDEFQAEIDKMIAIYRLAIARSDSLSVEEFADFRRLLESWSVFFRMLDEELHASYSLLLSGPPKAPSVSMPVALQSSSLARTASNRSICPKCGAPVVILRLINRQYCFNCKTYVD